MTGLRNALPEVPKFTGDLIAFLIWIDDRTTEAVCCQQSARDYNWKNDVLPVDAGERIITGRLIR